MIDLASMELELIQLRRLRDAVRDYRAAELSHHDLILTASQEEIFQPQSRVHQSYIRLESARHHVFACLDACPQGAPP